MSDQKIINAFFSDLDLTLIYSHRAIKRYHGDSYSSIVVEEYENKTLSYLKLDAWEGLRKNAGQLYHFIPTTTRTFEQYSRIKFPKIPIQHAIVLNGAKIYFNGIEDYKWTQKINEQINSYEITPEKIYLNYKEKIMKIPGVNKIRLAGDYFIYIVKEDSANPELEHFLTRIKDKYGYIISHQGRKSYIVPPCVDKGLAIKELAKTLECETIISAGDSKLDLSMDKFSDYFIQPKHGEAVGLLQHAHVTRKNGINSGSEIISMVEKFCKK